MNWIDPQTYRLKMLFNDGVLKAPSIKFYTDGNIHQRINARYREVVMLREFLRKHPANKNNQQ